MADPAFPEGVPTPGRGSNLLFDMLFAEKCMKMKKNGPGAARRTPLVCISSKSLCGLVKGGGGLFPSLCLVIELFIVRSRS